MIGQKTIKTKKSCNTYINTKCGFCGEQLTRQKFRAERGNVYCARPSYCMYAAKLKERDPKAFNILNNKNGDFYYMLGLICADGCVRYHKEPKANKSYFVEIDLNKKDRKVLDNIKNKFGGGLSEMHDNTVRWIIRNKIFVEYIVNIGITPNKSKTLDVAEWFKSLDFLNKNHFLRGMIDGDGMIKTFRKDRKFNICTGSKQMFEMLKNHIIENYNMIPTEQHNPTYSYIILDGKRMLPLLHNIYEYKGIYMKRKYIEYIKIKGHFEK